VCEGVQILLELKAIKNLPKIDALMTLVSREVFALKQMILFEKFKDTILE
jgi:hypothetical protein